MIRKIINFLSSLKLTISILIILAFTSIIGTLILQNQDPGVYIQQFGEPAYKLLQFLGFFDLYHSWWFVLLLVLLALNLIFCSIKRLSRDLKVIFSPRIKLTENERHSFTPQEKLYIEKKSEQETLDDVLMAMKKGGFPCQQRVRDEEGWHLFSEKGKYSRMAFYITHLSILLIFIGAIIGAVKGYKGFVNITEGEKTDSIITMSQDGRSMLRPLGFEVACEKFEVSFYPDEQGNPSARPKDYKSLLAIYDQGKRVLAKEIEVNDPLSYKDIFFYQSSYGEIPELNITVKTQGGDLINNFEVGESEAFTFNNKGGQEIKVRVLQYIPDFSMGMNNQPVNRSNQPNNPAALLEINYPDAPGQVDRAWVFQRFPDFPHTKMTEYRYYLSSTQAAKKYTGLQVVWDPGVPVVWAGCIILIIGIVFMFSFSHHRLWVEIINGDKSQKIMVIGSTNKNKPSFQNIFSHFLTDFKQNLTDRKK